MLSDALMDPKSALARLLDPLQAPFALASRVYVSWVFLKAGWLKLSDWDQTIALFEYEYHVPVLSPHLAAIVGTAGELVFSTVLILGLYGRLSALGLQAVNVLAVISYAHVLYQEGFAAAIGQHYLSGYILVVLTVHGPGAWSLDHWLQRRRRGQISNLSPTQT